MSDEQKFPAGWDEKRIRDVIDYYEGMSEDEQAEDIEAAIEAEGMTWVAVPDDLLPTIRQLLATHKSA